MLDTPAFSTRVRYSLLCASLALLPALAGAAPAVGQPAPDFSVLDSKGKTVKLSDFAGKPVVLEWTNEGCPYVRKWYGSGEMQKLQHDAADMGGIDSIASTRVEDIPKAEPYARNALKAVVAGQAVSKPVTRPYGCSVKYKG